MLITHSEGGVLFDRLNTLFSPVLSILFLMSTLSTGHTNTTFNLSVMKEYKSREAEKV